MRLVFRNFPLDVGDVFLHQRVVRIKTVDALETAERFFQFVQTEKQRAEVKVGVRLFRVADGDGHEFRDGVGLLIQSGIRLTTDQAGLQFFGVLGENLLRQLQPERVIAGDARGKRLVNLGREVTGACQVLRSHFAGIRCRQFIEELLLRAADDFTIDHL